MPLDEPEMTDTDPEISHGDTVSLLRSNMRAQPAATTTIFVIDEFLDPEFGELAAVAGSLHSAKRKLGTMSSEGVLIQTEPGLDPRCQSLGPFDVRP